MSIHCFSQLTWSKTETLLSKTFKEEAQGWDERSKDQKTRRGHLPSNQMECMDSCIYTAYYISSESAKSQVSMDLFSAHSKQLENLALSIE